MRSRPRWLTFLALLFAFALIAAACGSDDDEGTTETGEAEEEAPAEEEAATTTTAAAEEEAATTTTAAAEEEAAAAAAEDGDVCTEDKIGGSVTMGVFSETRGLDPIVSTGSGVTGGIEMAALYDVLMR